MPYIVEVSNSVLKEIKSLPSDYKETVLERINSLRLEPRPHGCKKLVGYKNYWRIRIGDYRIIYSIIEDKLFIEVINVLHRSKVYNDY